MFYKNVQKFQIVQIKCPKILFKFYQKNVFNNKKYIFLSAKLTQFVFLEKNQHTQLNQKKLDFSYLLI